MFVIELHYKNTCLTRQEHREDIERFNDAQISTIDPKFMKGDLQYTVCRILFNNVVSMRTKVSLRHDVIVRDRDRDLKQYEIEINSIYRLIVPLQCSEPEIQQIVDLLVDRATHYNGFFSALCDGYARTNIKYYPQPLPEHKMYDTEPTIKLEDITHKITNSLDRAVSDYGLDICKLPSETTSVILSEKLARPETVSIICPLSQRIMFMPVRLSPLQPWVDREFYKDLILQNGTDPYTRKPVHDLSQLETSSELNRKISDKVEEIIETYCVAPRKSFFQFWSQTRHDLEFEEGCARGAVVRNEFR